VLALASLIDDEKKLGDCQLDLWKQSYVAAYAAVFGKLQRSPRCPSSKGDLMVVANADDSRVVLGTASDDGAIMSSSSSST
jgi:hypothetical protein